MAQPAQSKLPRLRRTKKHPGCASCHQEQWCIRCHGSSARGPSLGGNPHGPNPQRLRGSAAQKQSARMCLKCHSPLDVA
ncbi:MAG: hypothetical protein HYV07_17720 [Deltaproteobacteria bacterium]|nr:hypothetical protein [Deltaproteobacteria bacterium]